MNAKVKMICLVGMIFGVLGLWLYSQKVTAQSSVSSISIAVCNPNRILQEYKRTISMRADLINERDRLRQEIDSRQKELQIKTEELTASGFSPDSDEYLQRRKELLRKSAEIETLAKFADNELRLLDTRITEVCARDIQRTVQKMAKKKGLTLVLQQFVYADDALDITAEVIQQLNTDYQLGG